LEVYDAILRRRSIRSFENRAVPDESLRRLLEAARWAPTGGNRQPWEFVAVRNAKKIRGIKMFSEGLSGYPTLIIAVCTPDRSPITLLDIGMAAENIMLECQDLGLGSCAIASFNAEPVKRLLEIPEDQNLVLLLSIGYPEGEPKIRPKKALAEFAYCERYGGELSL
jgi:nitroreductase